MFGVVLEIVAKHHTDFIHHHLLEVISETAKVSTHHLIWVVVVVVHLLFYCSVVNRCVLLIVVSMYLFVEGGSGCVQIVCLFFPGTALPRALLLQRLGATAHYFLNLWKD